MLAAWPRLIALHRVHAVLGMIWEQLPDAATLLPLFNYRFTRRASVGLQCHDEAVCL